MGSNFSFMNYIVKPNVKTNVYVNNEYDKFNTLKKYNEPLIYNVNIIKSFKPTLDTIYE